MFSRVGAAFSTVDGVENAAPADRAWHRARQRLVHHPVVADAALALVLMLAATVSDTRGPDGHRPGALIFDVLLTAPLALRRRWPAAVGSVVAGICLVQWATGTFADGANAVLVVLYTLGSREHRRWVLVAALVVGEIGVVLAATRWAPHGGRLLISLTGSGTVLASVLLGVYVRMRRADAAAMLERALTAERDRELQVRLAVTAERARMAREVHDIVAHSLSVMITLNDAAVAVQPSSPASEEILRASTVGREALRDMRRLMGVLRGDDPAGLVPQPGTAQLPDLLKMVRQAGLPVELATTGDLSAAPATAQLAAYRVVQEGLTNVLKHGRNVTRVLVEVGIDQDRLTAQVLDDGDPAPGAAAESAGHGLAGMRERAAMFGGWVDAGPRPGRGWAVRVDLAFDPAR